MEDYHQLFNKPKDVIENYVTVVEKQVEVDLIGFDIHKFMALLTKSNPTCLEWLASPEVYVPNRLFEQLRDLFFTEINPTALYFHYLSMARSNFEKYIENQHPVPLKKMLYVARGILCAKFVKNTHIPPPVAYKSLLDNTLGTISNADLGILQNLCDISDPSVCKGADQFPYLVDWMETTILEMYKHIPAPHVMSEKAKSLLQNTLDEVLNLGQLDI